MEETVSHKRVRLSTSSLKFSNDRSMGTLGFTTGKNNTRGDAGTQATGSRMIFVVGSSVCVARSTRLEEDHSEYIRLSNSLSHSLSRFAIGSSTSSARNFSPDCIGACGDDA